MPPARAQLDAYDRYRSVKYFGSLDALRAFAIIAVIWQHCPGLAPGLVPFTNTGASGVALFFALSGFLITTLLLREESRTGGIDLRAFYARRALRIFPLYYAVLGLYTAIVIATEHNAAGRLFLHNLPYYATYTNNWFVDLIVNEDGQRRVIFIFAWSLATEEQFYLLWPWVMKYARRSWAVGLLIATIAMDVGLSATLGTAETPATPGERVLRIATSASTEICCGVLLALALHSRAGFGWLWAVAGKWWSAPLAAPLALAAAMAAPQPTPWWYCVQGAALCFLLASCVIREDHGLTWLLWSRALARIGVVSYGMYMLHMLSVNTVELGMGKLGFEDPMVRFVIAVVVAYAAAEASFRVFEAPMLKFKRRFAPRAAPRERAGTSVDPRVAH